MTSSTIRLFRYVPTMALNGLSDGVPDSTLGTRDRRSFMKATVSSGVAPSTNDVSNSRLLDGKRQQAAALQVLRISDPVL